NFSVDIFIELRELRVGLFHGSTLKPPPQNKQTKQPQHKQNKGTNPFLDPRGQSSSSIVQARRTVQQLRIEASIERIKVSKASSELMRYCGEHAKNDPLLMGIPASENPFKDKKPCTVL
uniref:Guanine nucleotide-binding protein subunit gamma n=1 Tax=Oreochromis aureus TaxID=47969 RepID=A0AAZ1WWF3_OREAU